MLACMILIGLVHCTNCTVYNRFLENMSILSTFCCCAKQNQQCFNVHQSGSIDLPLHAAADCVYRRWWQQWVGTNTTATSHQLFHLCTDCGSFPCRTLSSSPARELFLCSFLFRLSTAAGCGLMVSMVNFCSPEVVRGFHCCLASTVTWEK